MGLQFDPETSIAPQTAGNPLLAAGGVVLMVVAAVLFAIIATSCGSDEQPDVDVSPFDRCHGMVLEQHDRCIAEATIEAWQKLLNCGDQEPGPVPQPIPPRR